MRNPLRKSQAFLLACVALLNLTLSNVAWARNPWASAVGEACVVQHRAEDIANRIKRTAPHSHLVRHAMAFDHLACSLVDRVKCGAPCNQVQGLYQQLQGSWNQLRVAIYTDPCLCSDRTLKSLADGMDTRMRNLCRAIERVVEREFRCPPSISYNLPHGYVAPSPSTLHLQFQSSSRIPLGVPSNSIHFGVPSYSHRVSPQPSYGFQNPSFHNPYTLDPDFPALDFHGPNRYGPNWNPPTWPNPDFGPFGPRRAF